MHFFSVECCCAVHSSKSVYSVNKFNIVVQKSPHSQRARAGHLSPAPLPLLLRRGQADKVLGFGAQQNHPSIPRAPVRSVLPETPPKHRRHVYGKQGFHLPHLGHPKQGAGGRPHWAQTHGALSHGARLRATGRHGIPRPHGEMWPVAKTRNLLEHPGKAFWKGHVLQFSSGLPVALLTIFPHLRSVRFIQSSFKTICPWMQTAPGTDWVGTFHGSWIEEWSFSHMIHPLSCSPSSEADDEKRRSLRTRKSGVENPLQNCNGALD